MRLNVLEYDMNILLETSFATCCLFYFSRFLYLYVTSIIFLNSGIWHSFLLIPTLLNLSYKESTFSV